MSTDEHWFTALKAGQLDKYSINNLPTLCACYLSKSDRPQLAIPLKFAMKQAII
jgi:hypothetical protein